MDGSFKLNDVTEKKIILECAAGSAIYSCIEQAMIIALFRKIDVEFSHNERIFKVKWDELGHEIRKQHP